MKEIFFAFFFLFSFGNNHDFHISKCNIDFNSNLSTIEISINLFIDDTELTLTELGFEDLKIGTDKENKNIEELLFNYLNQKFKLYKKANSENQLLKYTFIGKEITEDLQSIWCYLKVENINPSDTFIVSNEILTELFDDQINIIHINTDGEKMGYFLFDLKKNSAEFILN